MTDILKDQPEIIISAVIVILLLIWKLKKSSPGGSEKNVAYIQKNDPGAQSAYDKSRKNEEKPMTLKERLELSWQFLYDITDIVLGKFSAADQDATLSIGKVLLENGGHYEHVIDYGIKHNLGRAQSKGMSKEV